MGAASFYSLVDGKALFYVRTLTFRVISLYCPGESFCLFLLYADSQPFSTLDLSKCRVGRACKIYGLHPGPADWLAQVLFCPSGLDRMAVMGGKCCLLASRVLTSPYCSSHALAHLPSHLFAFPFFHLLQISHLQMSPPLLATHLCSVWTCRLESQILAPPPSCFSLSSSFVWPLLTSPPALSLWGLSRWAAVCSSTYLSSSYPSSKLIKKCLRSPLTSLCPPTADLLKLVNWSPFILIIVWIFHVCDLWIKHRI